MHSEHHLLATLRDRFAWHRDIHADHQSFLEMIMSEVERLITSGEKLLAESLAPLQAEVASVKAANVDLQSKLDAANATIAKNESEASAAADKIDAAIAAAEAPTPATPTSPVVTTTADGSKVTVTPATDTSAGTTTHEDATTGIVTTVDHATGDASAVSVAGNPVPVEPAAVQAATDATAAAGVAVPVA